MDLYFAPLACSMATRIALYEAGADARFIQVDTKAKRVADGTDFLTINPLGMVPVIRTDDGALLTENAAILQYVAERFPAANLVPAGGIERARLQQWLCFIGTELHKYAFVPILDSKAPEEAKRYARTKAEPRLAYLNDYLNGREFLLDRFSVADAYLTTVLNWGRAMAIDLAAWPAVKDYFSRMRQRPSIARALAEEGQLYAEEQARQKAA
jgi:glutathione S-transferase